jgi:hypothetical protein
MLSTRWADHFQVPITNEFCQLNKGLPASQKGLLPESRFQTFQSFPN